MAVPDLAKLGEFAVEGPVVAGVAEGEEVLEGRELDLVGDVLAAAAEGLASPLG